MKCPNCKLENPPTALRCDCGYDFPSGIQKQSYILPQQSVTPAGVRGGVGGWLLVLCLILCVFGPLGCFLEVVSYPSPLTVIVALGIGFYGFAAGYKLWTIKPGAVRFARTFLIVNIALRACLGLIAILTSPKLFSAAPFLNIWTIIWFVYLGRSERVAITYGKKAVVH
jgi:hypothetical protein